MKQTITKQGLEAKPSFSNFFYLVSKGDLIYLIAGLIFTMLNGGMQPIFCLLTGEIAAKFSANNTPNQVESGALQVLGWFIGFGVISFILSTLMMYCSVQFGENQAIKFRKEYYKQLISQDVSYFDLINSNELSTKMSSDCFKIQQAIGEKLCLFVYSVSIVIGNVILSFIRGWQLALISCTIIPVATLVLNIVAKITQNSVKENSMMMQTAGGLTEQALSAIKKVKSLQGEEHETSRYTGLIQQALQKQFRFNFLSGVSFGFQSMIYFLNYSLPFWVGSIFIQNDVYNHSMGRMYEAQDIITIFTCILLAGMKLSVAMNSFKIFFDARVACSDILKVLNSIPTIKQDNHGTPLDREQVKGEITFQNVSFSYPSRKGEVLLRDASFTIQPQKKTAIVGKSGCGKSTVLQLIEHFYEPNSGNILLDNVNVKQIQLNSLRKAIGYVSQEPILFAATIRENLMYAKPDASESEMVFALTQANIWDFIESLEKKLDTFVGNSGAQLSGGQKQRICIARAILRNPPILLLDEATSALDCQNEVQVQAALDQASVGRTTVVVAHNLQTIQNADQIIVIDQGQVLEEGSHDQLMERKGFYYDMQIAYLKGIESSQEQKEVQMTSSSSDSSPSETVSPIYPLFNNNIQQTVHSCLETKNTLPTMNELPLKCLTKFKEINTLHHLDDKTTLAVQEEKSIIHINNTFNSPLPEPETKLKERRLRIEQLKQNSTLQLTRISNKKKSLTPKSNKNKQQRQIDEEKDQVEEAQKMTTYQVLKRLFSYDRKILLNLMLGLLFSIGNGVSYPLCGWVLGKLVAVLLDPNSDDIKSKSDQYSLFLTLIGVIDLTSIVLQYYFTSISAQKISFILRRDLFTKYLKMPIAWFDKPQNSSSQLSLSLQQNCEAIHTLVGSTFAYNFQAFVSVFSSILIAFSGDWRTSLIGLVLVPLFLLSHIIYAIKMSQLTINSHKSSISTVTLINESACNIRTIASFGDNQLLISNFAQKLSENIKNIKRFAINAGVTLGLANFSLFLVYGITFYMGAYFHKHNGATIEQILISIEVLIISASGLGKSAFFLGDARSSAVMAKNIFGILDSKDEQQLNYGKEAKTTVEGDIEFKNVSFYYPQRKDQYILRNVSFKIPAKSKVAFVGTSGAGKSSIIMLLQRFYSNYSGQILLDGVELRSYDLSTYRSALGTVQQEPTLFSGTIKENIQYNTKADFKQIKEAAQKSNALQFIEELSKNGEDGFEKQVGIKGNQLSGGQKQRIAISQVILRQPQIVLLDEVTSALDSHNEQIVQQSIEETFNNHTTISVAHRLNTIKHCDIIFMLDQGQIVEQGTYDQLIDSKSHFYQLMLHTAQN